MINDLLAAQKSLIIISKVSEEQEGRVSLLAMQRGPLIVVVTDAIMVVEKIYTHAELSFCTLGVSQRLPKCIDTKLFSFAARTTAERGEDTRGIGHSP